MKIAKSLLIAEPALPYSPEWLRKVVADLRGQYWDISEEDIESVKQLL